MLLKVRQFRLHEQFHQRNWRTSSSVEFHGIPWNLEWINFADSSSSMQFHGISWNLECVNFDDTSCSMEIHGIPWNLGFAKFADTSSCVEFHGSPWNLECVNFDDTSSSIEFHRTSFVIIIYVNFEFAWILVEFETCIIPTELAKWCWLPSYNAFIFLFSVR